MQSVMKNHYALAPQVNIPRSKFDLSHGVKTSFDADYLIPIGVWDVIPGDTWVTDMNFMCRLATPLHPIMDNLYLDSFTFFIPYRLVWKNFEKFHGAQDDPGDSIAYTIPAASSGSWNTTDITNADYRTLANYLGIPVTTTFDATECSALPFRAYNLVYDEWFRDENLTNAVWKDGVFGTDYGDDGPDGSTDFNMLKRSKRRDYFTSSLPWPQKGSAVSLPLGTSAPVLGIGVENVAQTAGNPSVKEVDGATHTWNGYYQSGPGGTQDVFVEGTTGGAYIDVRADLSSATAADINDLRLAFQTQRLLERDARSGTRYTETLLAHWGVSNGDARLQRPELLGGGSTRINVTPVANTTAIDSTADPASSDRYPGDLTGYGTVSGQHSWSKSFTEHGVILTLINLRGDITYSQGIDRYWTKSTRYDFAYPVLSQLGEQAVLLREIYYDAADNEAVWGYQERYAEYRHLNSRLTGLFGVDISGTLSSWHLSEDFAAEPSLGNSFIQANTGTPLDRAIAVSTEPHMIGDFHFNIRAARPLPLYGVPGNLDHL